LAAGGDVDGFNSNDAAMLELAEEMVALTRTRLTLVVTAGVGHNPLRASALLMTYLPEIARRLRNESPRGATIYRLVAARMGDSRTTPGQHVDRLAGRRNITPQQLMSETLRRIGAAGA
jgi:hypothetical protein